MMARYYWASSPRFELIPDLCCSTGFGCIGNIHDIASFRENLLAICSNNSVFNAHNGDFPLTLATYISVLMYGGATLMSCPIYTED